MKEEFDETEDKAICEEIWRNLITYGGYSSEVDEAIVKIMRCIKQKMFYTDICTATGYQTEFVQLVQFIVCTMDYAEYGTSPRGCWLTTKGEQALEVFEKRLKSEAE